MLSLTLCIPSPSPCNKQRVFSQKIYPLRQTRIVCRNSIQVQGHKFSSLSYNPLREFVMNKKVCGFGAVCHSGPLTPRNLQWVSTISTAVLMLARDTSIHRSFLAPLFALQAPASIVSWIKGEYGIWTAFLALLVRLFFFIPGELELPFIALLLVILAPNQVMSRLRGTQEGIILTLIIAAYLAYQHFSRTGSLARAFDQGSIFATLAIICIVVVSCLLLI
ncbi:cold-regulated 413 inner membrane protein 1, chloroplastic-like [Primulina huaijiensis]|uniref:cold-regulated 413 inner membrane protein 1, chloroplastic-like n=1 Tax=Primulina huaijiensis TaxID=1492673 RepID=UPI003CC6FA5E